MRPTRLAAAVVCSLVALVGFAGAAEASATLDLVWIDVTDSTCTDADRRDCPQLGPEISSVFTSENITLAVIVTAGPRGYIGGQMSVDYSDALPTLSVAGFRRLLTTLPEPYLPADLSNNGIHDTGSRIETMQATAVPFAGSGIGLPAGQTAYIGTVTFHLDVPVNGVFEIGVDTQASGDGIGNLEYEDISIWSKYNSAYLIAVGVERFCTDSQGNLVEIEVNTLRAGGRTVSAGPNQTVDVTAKARIPRGTAVKGTTIDATLTIQAVAGSDVVGMNSTAFEAVPIEVGKGGNGAKLAVDVPRCSSGFIDFVAEFSGTDDDGELCVASRILRKACR